MGTLPITHLGQRRSCARRASSVIAAGSAASGVGRAWAAVIEPNGVSVPGPPNTASETPLQSYFTSQGEGINAVNDASTQPGVFLPLCDFKATLVLSQSNAQAGIDWYNQPMTPTGPPPAASLNPIGRPCRLWVRRSRARTSGATSTTREV